MGDNMRVKENTSLKQLQSVIVINVFKSFGYITSSTGTLVSRHAMS